MLARVHLWLSIATVPMVIVSLWLNLVFAPNERTMGPVQRILYFHAPSATTAYLCAFILLVAGIGYLSRRHRLWDAFGVAAAEVGLLFSSIVLATGMIWGRFAWNTWFRFEPRLVTFLLLWFIFVALCIVNRFAEPEFRPRITAVLGVLAALTVPFVMAAIELFPGVAQLHPQVVSEGGLRAPEMRLAFATGMIVVPLLGALLLVTRARLADLEYRINEALYARSS